MKDANICDFSVEHLVDITGWNRESDICVTMKFRNIQEEITQNDICTISHAALLYEMGKSKRLLDTKNIREICCVRTKSYYHMMKQNELPHLRHILAMMLYCNHDVCL